MLRCYNVDLSGNLDDHLLLVEFTYNNSNRASIGMTSYDALYEKPGRSPLCWTEPEKHVVMGPQVIKETTKKNLSHTKLT